MLVDFQKEFVARLRKVRLIPDTYNSVEFRKQCWEDWKHSVPCDKYFLMTLSDDDMARCLIAHQLYFYDALKDRLANGACKEEFNIPDLNSFLNNNINKAIKGKTLLRAQQGLDFCKDFVRDIIYQTGVRGKYPDPLRNMDDVRSFHRAICICFEFNNIDKLTISKIANTMQLTGSVQVVSNFRCMTSAYLFHKYAIDCNPNKKEINICVPSEGFLGRLLSSYYIAYHNRDKQINYYTIDPNEALREPFEKMVAFLKKQGGLINRVTNWNPILLAHGSEVDRARLKKHLGVEMDITFTSPPYGVTELYLGSVDLYLCREGVSMSEQSQFLETHKTTENCTIKRLVESDFNASPVKVGDKYLHDGVEYVVCKVNKDTQSHTVGKKKETWNELFFRPTVANMKENLSDSGYMIWNVGNTKAHPTLENDVVQICTEEGMVLVDTLEYELSRRPGSRDIKPPFEPVFVFKKKENL